MKGSTLPFEGTPEQEAKLRAKCRELLPLGGATMPALQYAQELYGYLPYEVQMIVAEELGVTLADVYGVVTFYSQFSLYPKGKYRIGICLGTACYVKGSGDLFKKIEGITRFSVHFIYKRKYRYIPHYANLKKLSGLVFNPLRRVDNHYRGIRSHQRSVGVLGKVLMSRRIQNIYAEIPVTELKHR
mgnify:CR=1 FL=1